jgi:hypothetical protein
MFDVLIGVKTISLNFAAGWNMFSYNVAPKNEDPSSIFASVVNDVVVVINGEGESYIPEFGIDQIEKMSFKEGYIGYFSAQTDLDISGQPVDQQTPIELPSGWSMIGYLPDGPADAEEALASIVDNLIIAKDGDGNSFIPAFAINQLGNMHPGYGYQVYLEENSTLVYPSVPARLAKNSNHNPNTSNSPIEHFQFKGQTGENASIVIPLEANPRYPDDTPLESGDEIGVFTSTGLCCGATVWEESNTAITVWGDDVQTDEVDGFKAGDTMYFRIWQKSKDIEHPASAVYKNDNPIVYATNGFSVLVDLSTTVSDIDIMLETMPEIFGLEQNFPNPFNPTTMIKFSIAKSSDITLTVFNLNGQKVRTLIRQHLSPGQHSVQWDSHDDQGLPVSSGTYFYQLLVQQGGKRIVDVKKMILMR